MRWKPVEAATQGYGLYGTEQGRIVNKWSEAAIDILPMIKRPEWAE